MSALKLSDLSVCDQEFMGAEPVIVFRSKFGNDSSVKLSTSKVIDNKRVFVSRLVLESLPPEVIIA